MRFLILASFTTLLAAQPTFAKPATDLVRLNRLSQKILGHSPSEEDRAQLLIAKQNNTLDQFFEKKIDQYLATEEHARKMTLRLENLFKLKIAANYQTIDDSNVDFLSEDFLYARKNAMSYLFAEMARKNKSWDELLTGKTYRLFNSERVSRNAGQGVQDFGFLAAIVPDLKSYSGVFSAEKSSEEFRDVQFDQNDDRIAGAITTSRFFTRFVTTGLNKNRRRAAEIFRIFLCDSMSAAIPSSEGQDDQIYDLMLPHDPTMTENELRQMAQNADSLHGSRPDCKSCHFKLDPMGRNFMTSALVLAPQPTSGALSFKRNAQVIHIPTKGLGDLGLKITEQPEYLSCQVEHFWNWFVGDRYPLSSNRKNILTAEFERVGRKTNDFIKYLVAQPEFSEVEAPLTEDQLMVQQVKTTLQRCQNCHKDQFNSRSDDGSFPDFLRWPIDGSAAQMKLWLEKISKEMDLAHNGENPKMPPKEALWRSSLKEVKIIKKWIDLGAPNENGQRQVQ